MRRALDSYVIRGVRHNTPLLRSVLDVPAFVAGNLSTAFLAEHYPSREDSAPSRLPLTQQQEDQMLALAAMLWLDKEQQLASGPGLQVPPARDPRVRAGKEGIMQPNCFANCLAILQCCLMLLSALRLPFVQVETPLVLSVSNQQVPATVRPAKTSMVQKNCRDGGVQAMEVQLPHRILYVQKMGHGDAQLVQAEVDGQEVCLQVLEVAGRQYKLQHCGAQRVVRVESPLLVSLGHHMPLPRTEDLSKVGCCWACSNLHCIMCKGCCCGVVRAPL